MSLLALNTIVTRALRVRYQIALGAMPIGFMVASCAPSYVFAEKLAAHLGISSTAPIRSHPNGASWILGFLAATFCFMVLGYVLGWVLNALIARRILGWPPEEVRAVYLRSQVPSHWLTVGSAGSLDLKAQAMTEWEQRRSIGAARFILHRGVFAWGAPMLLVMYITPTLVRGWSFRLGELLFNFALWALAGAAFGAAIWFSSERSYRKMKGSK